MNSLCSPPTLRPRQRLEGVLDVLLRSSTDGLPVISRNGEITGWVSHRDVLFAYQRQLQVESRPARTDDARRMRNRSPAGATAG
ncbi:MAG: CBS domain-containing protein [Mycobacteriales bacterium]